MSSAYHNAAFVFCSGIQFDLVGKESKRAASVRLLRIAVGAHPKILSRFNYFPPPNFWDFQPPVAFLDQLHCCVSVQNGIHQSKLPQDYVYRPKLRVRVPAHQLPRLPAEQNGLQNLVLTQLVLQRSHYRAEQHQAQAAVLLSQARLLDPPPRRRSRVAPQGRQPALRSGIGSGDWQDAPRSRPVR